MNVNPTPHLEAMARQKVASGRDNNASEVVREALRLLEEQDNLHRLRAALAVGQDQLDRGEDRPYTPELLEELKRQATENARLGIPIPDEVKP
jgi:antitoxin ParD1/3/4